MSRFIGIFLRCSVLGLLLLGVFITNAGAQTDPAARCNELYNAGNFVSAGDCYLSIGDYWRAAISYEWVCITAERQGDYASAVQFALKAIEYHNIAGNREGLAGAYYHAGWDYYNLKNYNSALSYYAIRLLP